jgi:hypothetical protein
LTFRQTVNSYNIPPSGILIPTVGEEIPTVGEKRVPEKGYEKIRSLFTAGSRAG